MMVAVLVSGCASNGHNSGTTATNAPPSPTVLLPATTTIEVEAFLDSLIGQTGSTGGIVAVQRGSAAPVIAVAGETGEPAAEITTATRWRVASVTKSYVSALALAMADEGLVDLDAPIATYIEYPRGDDLTLRQLLQHTSGLSDFGDPSSTAPIDPLLVPFERRYDTAAALAATEPIARDLDPSRAAYYSNANYVVAGAVLEQVGGASLGELLAARVFEPAALDATWYEPSGPVGEGPVAGLNDLGDDTVIPSDAVSLDSLITLLGPATGSVSDLDDLLQWADTVYRTQRLGEVDISAMLTIDPGGYGLGVAGIDGTGTCIFDGCAPGTSFARFTLSGDTPGASTRIWYDPPTDTIVLVYLNRNALALDVPIAEFVDGLG